MATLNFTSGQCVNLEETSLKVVEFIESSLTQWLIKKCKDTVDKVNILNASRAAFYVFMQVSIVQRLYAKSTIKWILRYTADKSFNKFRLYYPPETAIYTLCTEARII